MPHLLQETIPIAAYCSMLKSLILLPLTLHGGTVTQYCALLADYNMQVLHAPTAEKPMMTGLSLRLLLRAIITYCNSLPRLQTNTLRSFRYMLLQLPTTLPPTISLSFQRGTTKVSTISDGIKKHTISAYTQESPSVLPFVT